MNLPQLSATDRLNRRQMIQHAGIAVAGLVLAGCALPRMTAKPKKVLFFSKSSGYQHSVITRHGNELSFAEKILAGLGPEHGIKFVFSKDGSLFSPEYVAQFDAFAFFTCNNPLEVGTDGFPAMTPAGKAALLEAVKNGKGFVGVHSASDTFHSHPADEYTKMLGGEFIAHGKQQKGTLRMTDTKFPGLQMAGGEIELLEELYSLKEFADNLHVLLVQETVGLQGAPYQRPPYPNTWARMHGKGRVFYTALGHREDVWTNPLFQKILFGGIAWVVRDVDADVTPNLKEVTPRCNELPPV